MIYEIQMSKGTNIKIDEEDLQKIQDNIGASLIRIKQAIINPSFMVCITPTDDKEFIVKPKIEVEDGVAKIIGEEKVALLADKMTIRKQLK